jgi:hypothetical protein
MASFPSPFAEGEMKREEDTKPSFPVSPPGLASKPPTQSPPRQNQPHGNISGKAPGTTSPSSDATQRPTTTTSTDALIAVLAAQNKQIFEALQTIVTGMRVNLTPERDTPPPPRERSTTPLDSQITIAKWKITDIGYFHPQLDKANGSSVYTEKQQVFYTEVDKFIKSFRATAKAHPDKLSEIKLSLYALLKGPAERWYHDELSEGEQNALTADLTLWEEALNKRWGIRLVDALRWLSKNDTLPLDSIVKGTKSVRNFAMDVLKYGRAQGTQDTTALLTLIYARMPYEIQRDVYEPVKSDKIGTYLDKLERLERLFKERLTFRNTALIGTYEDQDANNTNTEYTNWGTYKRQPIRKNYRRS